MVVFLYTFAYIFFVGEVLIEFDKSKYFRSFVFSLSNILIKNDNFKLLKLKKSKFFLLIVVL